MIKRDKQRWQIKARKSRFRNDDFGLSEKLLRRTRANQCLSLIALVRVLLKFHQNEMPNK